MANTLTAARWHKSTRSGATGACLEITTHHPSTITLRDSKNPTGPTLTITPTAFTTFITAVKTGTIA
jgi:hypothetical protein